MSCHRLLVRTSTEADSDGDGLLDAIEIAIGLNPRSADTDGDGLPDDDETADGARISNRLRYDVATSPYQTWAHYGTSEPRYEGWQSPKRFPMAERPERSPPRWSIEARQGMAYFTQRLSRDQSRQAIQRGFSLFIRVQTIHGFAGIPVDTSPAGPRFDVGIRRTSDRTIELAVLSGIVPMQFDKRVTIEAEESGAGSLIELRYRPDARSATVFVNGRREIDGYVGHGQFQDPLEGAVSWVAVGVVFLPTPAVGQVTFEPLVNLWTAFQGIDPAGGVIKGSDGSFYGMPRTTRPRATDRKSPSEDRGRKEVRPSGEMDNPSPDGPRDLGSSGWTRIRLRQGYGATSQQPSN